MEVKDPLLLGEINMLKRLKTKLRKSVQAIQQFSNSNTGKSICFGSKTGGVAITAVDGLLTTLVSTSVIILASPLSLFLISTAVAISVAIIAGLAYYKVNQYLAAKPSQLTHQALAKQMGNHSIHHFFTTERVKRRIEEAKPLAADEYTIPKNSHLGLFN